VNCVRVVILGLFANAGHQLGAQAQPMTLRPSVTLEQASALQFRGANSFDGEHPGETDCNSPAHWNNGTLFVFNSAGHPWRSAGPDQFHLNQGYLRAEYNNQVNGGRWIECTWLAKDGTLYGWYHNEPAGLCPGTHLTAPKIGAVSSHDNGAHWEDLGVVLEAPPNTLRCDTRNFYFAGGHGDFSVMLDARKKYLYFYISTYAGQASEQGIAVARMLWSDRNDPIGKVWKWHGRGWSEPGVGGQLTPIFSALTDWHQVDANAFWGPSIHWNSYLRQYVMLLNRAKDKDWAQEGIYVSFSRDLTRPEAWSAPRKILGDLPKDAWYPQVIGLDKSKGETDKLAGRVARLFVRGQSRWEIRFLKPNEAHEITPNLR